MTESLPQLLDRFPPPLRKAVVRSRDLHDKALSWIAKVDPNDDPEAEPLGILPLVALVVALFYSLRLYWLFKFQPMQDVGHHVGLSAIVTDFDRPGSIYPALYDRPDPLLANSLLYTVAGYLGRLTGVSFAFRVCMSMYLAGVPLANLYALRVFGRSAWPAVLAVPLVYGMSYLAGFANYIFAAPFMVMAVPCFYRAITQFTWKRGLAAALFFVLTFLSHAHVFLWLGALAFSVSLVVLVATGFGRHPSWRARGKEVGKVAGLSLALVLPSLLLFYRWYAFAFGEAKVTGGVQVATRGWADGFGMGFHPTPFVFANLWTYALKIYQDDADLLWLERLGILIGIALIFSRFYRWKRPPILELCFLFSLASYFFLPEGIDSNPVVGSRQVGLSLWLLPVLVTPVSSKVTRIGRWLVILGILYVTSDHLRTYRNKLFAFQAKEVQGLESVMEPLPYRKRMYNVKIPPDTSSIYANWKPLWHIDKYYMADRFGQVDDNPAIVSTSAIRYRVPNNPHRFGHSTNWPANTDLWDTYDAILVHNWQPTPEQIELAKTHARLIRKQGPWELWRKHGDWETQGEGPLPAVR